MIRKTFSFILAVVSAVCLGIACAGLRSVKANADEKPYFEVDSVQIHHTGQSDKNFYMLMSTEDGTSALTGYDKWANPDDATNALKAQMKIGDKTLADIDGAVIQYMDIVNAFCVRDFTPLQAGESIVIPEGTTFDNGLTSLKFVRTFTITWNGSAYSVTRSEKPTDVPVYEMPEGMLSDFTDKSVARLAGASYHESLTNGTAATWGVDYQSDKISGTFVSEADAPEGSTNGAYKMSWVETETLYYPSIMFNFIQNVGFSAEDELVIRVYLSEGMNMGFDLWVTSSTTENVWDPQTKFSGATLSTGKWLELRLSAADYMDAEGKKIAPINFTFFYANSGLTLIPAAEIYFDTAVFESVPKVIADDYKTEDISEIVPVGEGKTFAGDKDGNIENNLKFVRTDVTVNAVKMKLTVNDFSALQVYFVLNGGKDLYYAGGGVYFWISSQGFNMGYPGKNFDLSPLPESVKAGTAFELELRTIPYYVNGLKAGYYATALINGQEIVKGEYVASANCVFGTNFGFYMHNTPDTATVKIESVAKSENNPVTLTIKTQMNKKQIDVGDSVKLENKLVGNYIGQSDVVYEIVKGSDCGNIDDEGYLNGIKDGEVTIVAKVTNEFGTFSSDEITIKIGNGATTPSESNSEESSGGNTTPPKKSGCSGTVGGLSVAGLAIMAFAVVSLKKKKEDK